MNFIMHQLFLSKNSADFFQVTLLPRILSDFTLPCRHHTTRKQYQNRKRIKKNRDIFSTPYHHTFEDSFLITFSFPPFFTPFPPRHHIIVNAFRGNRICQNPLPSSFFPISFPFSSLKLFLFSYDQKSLMKPDTFDSKPFSSSCYTFILSIILSCSSFA